MGAVAFNAKLVIQWSIRKYHETPKDGCESACQQVTVKQRINLLSRQSLIWSWRISVAGLLGSFALNGTRTLLFRWHELQPTIPLRGSQDRN